MTKFEIAQVVLRFNAGLLSWEETPILPEIDAEATREKFLPKTFREYFEASARIEECYLEPVKLREWVYYFGGYSCLEVFDPKLRFMVRTSRETRSRVRTLYRLERHGDWDPVAEGWEFCNNSHCKRLLRPGLDDNGAYCPMCAEEILSSEGEGHHHPYWSKWRTRLQAAAEELIPDELVAEKAEELLQSWKNPALVAAWLPYAMGKGTLPVRSVSLFKAQAVRWVGAFGHRDDLDALIKFEANPGRPVACEALVMGHSGMPWPKAGLLVDAEKTELLGCYGRDICSPAGEVSPDWWNIDLDDRECPAWTDCWNSVENIPVYRYREALIVNPVYRAVVYRKGGEELAKILAEKLGIPVKAFEELQ